MLKRTIILNIKMIFSTLIDNFIIGYQNKISGKKETIKEIKNNLKTISKYIRGGISNLTKAHLGELTDSLSCYQKNKYIVGRKEIIPDTEQIKIIYAPTKYNIRVIACAGTGKTTTTSMRIKYLLDSHTTPDKFLVLTFNVEAKKSLETMIDRLMGFQIKMDIRTIDAFCLKLKCDFQNNFANYISLSELGVVGRKIMETYGSEICNQYKYVFFDEFQDVNEDQFQILKMFVNNGCRLMVIGDPLQCIYKFRGSDPYYCINFDKIIPNTITHKITTNYRSTPQIVELANNIISSNKETIRIEMKAHKSDIFGEIDLSIYNSTKDQITAIIKKIKYYVDECGMLNDNIAILARNTLPLKEVETEFEKEGLEYVALISDPYTPSDFKQIIQQGKIVLSTIHKAKGLEWECVFMIGMCDEYFPAHTNNGLKNIDEEKNLFYVGTTRAKKYLHFFANLKEIPLCRFFNYISKNLIILNYSKQELQDDLFDGNDSDNKKKEYAVTKIIEMLSGRKIEYMRNCNLIPDNAIHTTQIFQQPITYTDTIKKNVFESDYGIYVDYYMTRKIMIHNNQKISDVGAEHILLGLTMEEKILYDKYQIRFVGGKLIYNYPDTYDVDKIKILTSKLEKIIQIGYNLEQIMCIGISNYHYPPFFINKLIQSYDEYKNPTNNSSDIKQSIYYVSLCRKFNTERRRLVYRNIYDLYEENSKLVFDRVDEYVEMIKDNHIVCKKHMNKKYNIDGCEVLLLGEFDYLNISQNTLVDIKCSESDFKVEWLIQLLIYYAMYINSEKIDIQKVAVINIFSGKYHQVDIPVGYDWRLLLDYVGNIISDDLKGIREGYSEHQFITDNIHIDTMIFEYSKDDSVDNNIYLDIQTDNLIKSGYMVFDVENNTTNMDIIQLAYIIYDTNNTKIKKFNKYIKNRFVDNRAFMITGITTDYLSKNGTSFESVMDEFLSDMSQVSIICGHNINTDIKKIQDNLEKYHVRMTTNLFENIIICDTMSMYRELKGKPIKLSDMYLDLFGKSMINSHDALSDAEHTAECYVELLQRGVC